MVSYNNFESKEIFGDLTNYDIFMMNKNKKSAESRLFDKKYDKPVKISYEDYQKKMATPAGKYDYKEYLMEQLDRKSPDKILSEEEFKSQTASDEKNSGKKASLLERAVKKVFGGAQLRKGAKIFIACYVLIVMAVASILIVMNTVRPQKFADAGTGVVEQTSVQPMTLEEDGKENNWFDRLCDSLKN
ncbi:MAG: hypothetical protein PHC84_01630 [Clostridia bacterium]|nr:hypothetical protein [Clostridia bacterium]